MVMMRWVAQAWWAMRMTVGLALLGLAAVVWVLPGADGVHPDALPLRMAGSLLVALVGVTLLPRS